MLRLRIIGTDIRICFSLFAVVLFGLISGKNTFLSFTLACTVHELGHIAAMIFFGMKPKKIKLSGRGASIVPEGCFPSKAAAFAVMLGGAAANLTVGILLCESDAAKYHFFLCVYNLLPADSLDGGSLLNYFGLLRKSNVMRISECLSFFFTSLFLCAFSFFPREICILWLFAVLSDYFDS